MQKSTRSILISVKSHRKFSSSASDKLVASVLLERLPVVFPKIDPVVYAFQEFSLRWRQQFRRKYPDEVLGKADARGKGDYQIDYVPAQRITEADEQSDKKSLQRALDRRVYLLLYGTPYGAADKKPVWHFPEKAYENEESLRLCAELALKSVLGELQNSYFVGNAPVGHMTVGPSDESLKLPSFKRFFFKSQVVGTNQLRIRKCEDYAWLTKDEIKEHFPDQSSFFDKMIIS